MLQEQLWENAGGYDYIAGCTNNACTVALKAPARDSMGATLTVELHCPRRQQPTVWPCLAFEFKPCFSPSDHGHQAERQRSRMETWNRLEIAPQKQG